MTNVALCRVCLASDTRMYDIKGTRYQGIFEKLATKLFTPDRRPKTMCYICVSLLHRCRRFVDMSRKAENILTQLSEDGIQVTQENVAELNLSLKQSLSVTPIHYLFTGNIQKSTHVVVQEDAISMEEEETSDEELLVETVQTDDSSHAVVKEHALFINEGETPDEELLIDTVHTDDSSHAVVKEDAKFIMKVETSDEELLVETIHTDDVCHVDDKENNIFIKEVETADQELLIDAVHEDSSRVVLQKDVISMKKRETAGEELLVETVHTADSSYAVMKEDVFNNVPSKINVKQPMFETTYCCDYCSRTCNAESELALHINQCHTSTNTQKPFSGKKQLNQQPNTYSLQRQIVLSGEKPFACALCDKVYAYKRNLRVHMRVHTGEKPYACNICSKKFSKYANLTIHMRIHTREKPYACDICGKCFIIKTNLTTHMRIHTQEKPYSCDICGKAFNQKQNLTKHKKLHTQEKIVKKNKVVSEKNIVSENVVFSKICNIISVCSKVEDDSDHVVFNNLPSTTDVDQPTFKTAYSCSICNRTFKLKSKLAIHMKQYHTSQMPFSNEELLNRIANSERHLRVYSGEFIKDVETAEEERLVEAVHTDDSSHAVVKEDATFMMKVEAADQELLVENVHYDSSCVVLQKDVVSMKEGETAAEELLVETVHTADSSYAVVNEDVFNNIPSKISVKQSMFKTTYCCDYCSRTCNAKSELALHINQCHTSTNTQKPFSGKTQLNQQKPFACALCDKVYAYKGSLRVHMRVHTGEKPYACNICSKKFSKYANLTKHMRIHTREKPYACDICKKCFIQKTNLSTHMRIHTQEKPYSCDICGKAFNQKQHLTTHKKLHTQEEKPKKNRVVSDKIVLSENVVSSEICNIISVCSKVEDDSDHDVFNNLPSTTDVDQPTFKTAYSCSICNRTFKLKSKLAIHMKQYHTSQMPFSNEELLNRIANSERHLRVYSGEFIKDVETPEEERLVEAVHTDDSSHAVVKEDATFMMKVEAADQELLVENVHDDSSCVVLQKDVVSMKVGETAAEELLVETVHTADSSYAVVNEDVFNNVPSKINVKQSMFKTTYSCDFCSRTCNAKSELALHINQCHSSTSTQKPISGKKQLNQKHYPYGLQRQIVLCGEKTFACALCDKVYAHKTSLRIHERVHTGEKPFACEICGKKFKLSNNVKIHMRVHTQEKPYSCYICGKAFNQKQNLTTHQKIHAPEKQYSCDICSKTYHVKANLIRHKKVHIEKKFVSENFVPSEICNIMSVCSKVEDNQMPFSDEKQINRKASSERHLRVHSEEFIKDVKTAEEEHLEHTDDSSHAVVKKDAMFMIKVETADEGLLVETVHSDYRSHAVVKADAMFIKEVDTPDEELLGKTVHNDDSSHAVVKEDAIFIKKEETADEELLVETAHTNLCTVSSKEGYLIVTPTVHTQDSSRVTDTKEATSVDVSENLLSSEISNIISISMELEEDSDHDVFNNLPSTMDVERPKFETTHRCELCNETFNVKRKLTLHIKQCHTSQMQFSGEKQLNRNDNERHMGIHSAEKPYACALCGKVYARRANLTLHQRVHTGEKPFACEICGKCFNQKPNLSTHMRVHTREKPYSCDICGKDFNQKQNLKSHGRVHTREEPYSCEVCGETFGYKLKLQRHHIRIHQKYNPATF